MKTKAALAALVLVVALPLARLNAQPASPMERTLTLAKHNQLVMVIGHFVPGTGWKQATDRFISTDPGDPFTIFSAEGPLEVVRLRDPYRTLPGSVPADWTARVKRAIKEPALAVAVRGEWMESPGAKPQVLSTEDPAVVQIVSDYLKSNGMDVQAPLVTQAVRVSVGKGDEVWTVVCAKSSNEPLVSENSAEVYALALARPALQTEATPLVLWRQLAHKPKGRTEEEFQKWRGVFDTPEVVGVMDIDQDGGQEVVLYRRTDGADQVDVFTFRNGRPVRVLDAFKPLYN